MMRTLTDDTLLHLRSPADELIAIIPDETLFLLDPNENERYYKAQKTYGFKQRVIITLPHGKALSQNHDVRYLHKAIHGDLSYQVYGDRFVLINWRAPELLIIRSIDMAKTFRSQFDFLWSLAE